MTYYILNTKIGAHAKKSCILNNLYKQKYSISGIVIIKIIYRKRFR